MGTPIVDAATVVLLRRAQKPTRRSVSLSDIPQSLAAGWSKPQEWIGFAQGLFFSAGWQVLLGQSECQNWVRSEKDSPVPMRYGGEWKFPGGRLEPGETLQQAAWRELHEEFGASPGSAGGVMRLFNTKKTKAVRGTRFHMHNYVCLDDENQWLRELPVDALNARLARRRERFEAQLASGSFWSLGRQEREAMAPEVRCVEWLDLGRAVEMMLGSKAVELRPVDSWQASEFARLGVAQRDPMFQTFATLLEIEYCATEAGVRARCREMDAAQESSRL
jgi:ADP-ribose pyrophosphatase YjhB (NUDIX family)